MPRPEETPIRAGAGSVRDPRLPDKPRLIGRARPLASRG